MADQDEPGTDPRLHEALAAYLRDDPERAHDLADEVLAPGTEPPVPEPARAEALHLRGMACCRLGRHEAGTEDLKNAVTAFRACGDLAGAGRALDSLGNFLAARGRLEDAETYLLASLQLKWDLEDLEGEAITKGNLGRLKIHQGRLDEAEDYLLQDLEIARARGDARGVGIVLNNLGSIALKRGLPQLAAERFQASMCEYPQPHNRAHATLGLARTAMSRDPGRTETLCDRALGELDDLPEEQRAVFQAVVLGVRGEAALARGDLEAAIGALSESRTRLERHRVPGELLDVLIHLGRAYQAAGRTAEAGRTVQATFEILESFGASERIVEVEQWLRSLDRVELVRVILRRYLPERFVDGILAGTPAAGEARRRDVTVVFSDLRGFTAFSESSDPQDVTNALNRYLRHMVPVVRRHGGVVDKFIGDGIMAVFGAFDEGEGGRRAHASAAVRAALGMLDELDRFNHVRRTEGAPVFRMGVGVATGEAVVGNVGTQERMNYTAIGRPVNLASRLEGLSKELGVPVVLSEDTWRALDSSQPDPGRPDPPSPSGPGQEAWRRVDNVRLKGLEAPIAVYVPQEA